jgi:hypothetical protein
MFTDLTCEEIDLQVQADKATDWGFVPSINSSDVVKSREDCSTAAEQGG